MTGYSSDATAPEGPDIAPLQRLQKRGINVIAGIALSLAGCRRHDEYEYRCQARECDGRYFVHLRHPASEIQRKLRDDNV